MALILELKHEPLPLAAPFHIAGHVFEAMPAIVVTLRDGEYTGRGEEQRFSGSDACNH